MRPKEFKAFCCTAVLAASQFSSPAQLFPIDPAVAASLPPSSPSVTLAWNPSPEPLTEYFLYWGVISSNYLDFIAVGNVTNVTLAGCIPGRTYYFTVAAYDGAGQQSVSSNEIQYSVPQAATSVLSTQGVWTLTTLVAFDGTNGLNPFAGLTLGPDGNLYGTTGFGGAYGRGTVFQMTPEGRLRTLASFSGTNGGYPLAPLITGADGALYGTCRVGGTNGAGTAFRVDTNGVLTALASFDRATGGWPNGGLVPDAQGGFYGTTSGGSPAGLGSVFHLAADGLLHHLAFLGDEDGAYPFAGLIAGADSNFYGTTAAGGASGFGTVFRMTAETNLTTLYSFTGRPDGAAPSADLLQGTDGNCFGTTVSGGTFGSGTIFRLSSSGTFATLASFNGLNGAGPNAGLVQGTNGSLYGTTSRGGAFNDERGAGYGTVFELTLDGALLPLVSFNGLNGSKPQGRLLQGAEGCLYGTTPYGGPWDCGTIFRLDYIALPVLQATLQPNGTCRLSWLSPPGQTCQLQYKTNLAQPDWINLGGPLQGTNAVMSLLAPHGTDPQRLFRLLLLP